MKSSFFSVFNKLALTAAVATTLVGCGDPEYATPEPVTTGSLASARVLVVNASPGSQASAVTIDNVSTGQSINYLSAVSTGYLAVPLGQRQIGIVSPNNVTNAAGAVNPGVVRQAFATGISYTVFSTDAPTRTGSGTDLGGIRAIALTDNLAAPAAGRAKIRFVNLSSSGTYGIFNSVTQAALFSSAPTRAYRAISAGSGTSAVNFANFTEVNGGTYTLDVRSTATTPIANTQQVVTFATGRIYTLYVRGVANNATTPLGISVVQHN